MCFSLVLYVPNGLTNVRVPRVKLELKHFYRIIAVYAPAGLLVFGVIFYSLLPTLNDWKLMGGLNGPVFVCFKLMRKICKDAWCDDQNTHGMLRWRHSSLRNH